MGRNCGSEVRLCFPCKDCPRRHLACSTDCEAYKTAKDKHNEQVKKVREEKEMDYVMKRIISKRKKGS